MIMSASLKLQEQLSLLKARVQRFLPCPLQLLLLLLLLLLNQPPP